MKSLFTILLLLIAFWSYGQTVVVSEDVDELHEDTDYGMNRKHFTHVFIGLHFMAGPPENASADIRYGRSRSFEYGYRYKRRLSNTFSFGSEIISRRYAFHIKQSEQKLVPDNVIKDREKLVFVDVGLGVYKRINFGQRGNYIGRFMDAGAYASWIFHSRHVYFLEEDGVNIRVRKSGISYPAAFDYGVTARLGFNNWVLKGSYRMSDLFRGSAGLPELPRYTIGLEIGMHSF